MSKNDSRRQFLKKVIVSGTGSVTFVKAASAAAEPTLPAIVSLLLDEDNAPVGETVFDPLSTAISQNIEFPAEADFMHVDALGAGGGGSPSIQFRSEGNLDQFAAGAGGGAGGRVQAVFDLRDGAPLDSLGGSPVVEVGTGGRPGALNEPADESVGEGAGGLGGQFNGGRGGNTNFANSFNQPEGGTTGGGGGGFAAINVEGSTIILAGGGGGAGGGVGGRVGPTTVKAGGRGGDAGAFADADKRAGEDGVGDSALPALGGNRRYQDGVPVTEAETAGGSAADIEFAFNGTSGEGTRGGRGGDTFDDTGQFIGGTGGGGGAGDNGDGTGAGGGGGGGANSGGGGGAAGANFVNAAVAMPGFNIDAGVGGAGGQGGLAGETAETSANDLAGEVGAPAQVVITFFKDDPS